MIPEFFRFLLEFLKLAPRYLLAVALFSGLLLFLPEGTLERMRLLQFAEDHSHWLGVAFLLSAIVWGIDIFIRTCSLVVGFHGRHQARVLTIQRLHALTEDEKQILRYYIAQGTRSNKLRIDNGVVNGLVAAGIIYRASDMGSMLQGFAHNITDIAWNYLHKHPRLLEGRTNTYKTDDLGI